MIDQAGREVILSPIAGDRDYELLAQWCSSVSGTLTAGTPQYYGATEIKQIITQGPAMFLMVRLYEGPAVGAVQWEQLAYPGSYKIGSVIGDDTRWGAGFGLMSIKLLLDYLFHARNAHRVQITAGVFNKPMMEIFCTGLLQVEAVLRDYYFLDGSYHDAVIVSLLRDEYYQLIDKYATPPADAVPAGRKHEGQAMLREYLAAKPIQPSATGE